MSVPDPVTTGVVLAGALQIAKQAQEFIAAAAGHPGETIGTILGNITHRRLENLESVGNRAHLILLNIGVTAGEARLNVLQPALEAASLEEDATMQERWANLLANAADPRHQNEVAPTFPIILKELTSREVKFLDALYSNLITDAQVLHSWKPAETIDARYNDEELMKIFSNSGLTRVPLGQRMSREEVDSTEDDRAADRRDFSYTMALLRRHNVMTESVWPRMVDKYDAIKNPDPRLADAEVTLDVSYSLTELGYCFVKACRPPVP
jgi:hypothetical protein